MSPLALLSLSDDEALGMRRVVRGQMADMIPPDEIDIVTDLVIQAVSEAFSAADRVLNSAPSSSHYLAIAAPTISILAGRSETLRNGIESFAKKQGIPTSMQQVNIGKRA